MKRFQVKLSNHTKSITVTLLANSKGQLQSLIDQLIANATVNYFTAEILREEITPDHKTYVWPDFEIR